VEKGKKEQMSSKCIQLGLYVGLIPAAIICILVVILHLKEQALPTFFFITLLTIGSCIIFLLSSDIRKLKKDNHFAISNLKDSFQISNKLLTSYYTFVDNFIINSHSLFKDEKELVTRLSEYSLSNDCLSKDSLEKITSYLEGNIYIHESAVQDDVRGSLHELFKRLEDHNREIELFLQTLKAVDIKKEFVKNVGWHIDLLLKKEQFLEMVTQYEYYSELISDFINSIINNINSTSKPLSTEIFSIKKIISLFVKNVKLWKEELFSETSGKNFNNLISKYNQQNVAFNGVSTNISRYYKDLENQLGVIVQVINKITENSSRIQDISENINILSINASIQAARAGNEGKGFKVISNEIKALSESTDKFIKDIIHVIGQAKEIANQISSDFHGQCQQVTDDINNQITSFNTFYTLLQEYHNEFNVIFTSVHDLTESIDTHINRFNPIFQFQDMSVQELDNMNKVITKFLTDNREIIDKVLKLVDEEKKKKILTELLSFVEKKLTTDAELMVLDGIYDRHNLEKKRNIQPKDVSVELF
jgi:methyl-accepting chemotaxis protein